MLLIAYMKSIGLCVVDYQTVNNMNIVIEAVSLDVEY